MDAECVSLVTSAPVPDGAHEFRTGREVTLCR
jgi:hypothetical protein